jgi:hypothetical protein
MATPYTNVSGNEELVTKDDYNFFLVSPYLG